MPDSPNRPGPWWAHRHRSTLLMLLVGLPIFGLLAVPKTHQIAARYWSDMQSSHAGWVLFLSAMLLSCVILMNTRLERLNYHWLEWSPFRAKANVTLLPLTVKYFGAAYLVALSYSIPFLAWIEEMVFRNGTDGWLRGVVVGGFVFGFVHLVSFVTIRMAFCLSFAGIGLVAVYMMQGLWAATLVHATYNLLAVAWIVWSELGVGATTRKLVTHRHVKAQFPTIILFWKVYALPRITAPARD